METTEKNMNEKVGPIAGIVIVIALLGIVGVFFYNSVLQIEEDIITANEPVVTEDPAVPVSEETTGPLQDEQDIAVIEQELEEVAADIEAEDLFGIDQLDAELIDFTEIDALLDFEL